MNEETFVSSYVVDDDILVLKLHGQLDRETAPRFNAEVEKHFAKGRQRMIIDCAHLGYVSSFEIGTLVTMRAKLRKQGGEVKLAAIQSPVAEVFKIVRLNKLFDMYGDIEFARESFYK